MLQQLMGGGMGQQEPPADPLMDYPTEDNPFADMGIDMDAEGMMDDDGALAALGA